MLGSPVSPASGAREAGGSVSAVPSAFPGIISTQCKLARYSCLISEAEIQDVPGRTIIVKNKLAASTELASRGDSSKPTDEAS